MRISWGTLSWPILNRRSSVPPAVVCTAMPRIDVLDLPQIYTKPSARTLLDTLALLTAVPPSWDRAFVDTVDDGSNGETNSNTEAMQVNPEGVTSYLTSIISSSLQWIEDEDAKEEILNQASLRLSERSGRTAMGAISRKFRIPTPTGTFELSIHEPALTGDDLGLKTWAASYLLAKRLHTFQIVQKDRETPRVLELGSGTGLVGLAMAGLGAHVFLTDLPSISQNLAYNAQANAGVVEQSGGSTRTGVLDWNAPSSCLLFPKGTSDAEADGESLTTKFPLILAADSLYSPEHPRMLVDTIKTWLSQEPEAQVIVEFPYRDAYLPEIRAFRERMTEIGLRVSDEGEEKGFDDWGWSGAADERDDDALVTCWWSCWKRIT